MNILKKIMIIMAIIIILTIVIIFILMQSVRMSEKQADQTIPVQSTIQKVETYDEYVSAMYCVRNNLYQNDDYRIITVKEMYDQEETRSLIHYYIKATTKEITNMEQESEYYVIATLDYENYNYQITEITKEDYEDYIAGKKENTIKTVNTTNKFTPIDATDEQICQILLDDVIGKLSDNIEEVYNLLTKECKQQNFQTYESFQKYVEEKEEVFSQVNAKKYKIDRDVEYTKYTIVDENDNQYIFYETSPLNYTLEIIK